MVRFIDRFRRWRELRRALALATEKQDFIPLAQLIERRPAAVETFAGRARAQIDAGAYWSGLCLCLGLIHADQTAALELWRGLKPERSYAPHWKRFRTQIGGETAHVLLRFLHRHGTPEDLETAYERLGQAQLRHHLGAAVGEHDEPPIRALQLLRPLLGSSTRLPSWDGLDEVTIGRLVRLFFTHGSSEDVDVVFRRLGRHHLLAAILEARRAPRAAYLPALRRVWWSLEAEVRSDFDQSPAEEPQPYVLACADATAAALGACAARDPDYRDFSADQTHRTELEELYRKHREHVEEHNRLVEAYKAGRVAAGMILPASEDEPVVEMIKNLRRMIEASEHHLRQAEVRYRDRMSPGFILWRILADAQGYPIAVRQGAAHGLYQLLADGHLDDAAREEVFELLRTAVSGEDARDFGERRVRLPAAADRTELRASLADGLQWMLDLMEGIGERWQRQWRATLARRGETSPEARPAVDPLLAAMKRLQPGAEDVEPEEAVDGPRPPAGPPSEPPGLGNAGEGASAEASPAAADEEAGTPAERLALFDQLLAEDRPSVEERFPRLDEIAGGLIERLPGAVAFLQRYPLRLMRRDHQRALFGLYAKQPIRVQLWTRYTPPKNAGPVHRRYLALDDRSTPNSMGIAYPLFRHPLLALPVVYHEYLHYGGTTGDPENGIGNETEVLLREILFARRLIAELAPAEDDRLGDFERQLIDEIRAVGLDPLLPQLLCDLRRDDVLEAINRSVLATYGERLDAEQARRQAEVQIHLENVGIELSNRTLTWDPQIRWPHLGSESTRELTDRFRRVLVASRRIDHRVSRAQRDAVLQDADSAAASTAWQSYRRRAGAGVALAAAHPPVFTPLTIIRLLAQVREPLAA